MSLNSNRRKTKPSTNNKYTRNRGGAVEKNMACDGVYSNTRLMHTAASLVGCIVQVQVRNGAVYEGIFRTFSNQCDLVLEVAHKVDVKASSVKGLGPAISCLLESYPFEDGVADKLIFRLKDVVTLKAMNVDLDYANKDNFTDTAISKYNGQVTERELEPWEGPSGDVENIGGLGVDEEDGANGWDANDMFRTNAEKYGVKSTYNISMQEYTVPLTKKNTEEYRKQEAKAMKIAQEIESNISYQSYIQLENGDEEDKYSAVVRPENSNANKYLPPQKRKNMSGPKRPITLPVSTSPMPSSGPKPYPLHAVSNSNVTSSQGYISPYVSCSASAKQSQSPPVQSTVSSSSGLSSMPLLPMPKDMTERTINGDECEQEEKQIQLTIVTEHVPPIIAATKPSGITPSQPLPPRSERRRDSKGIKQKGRDDEIEEFKKFSSNFKLCDETKECKEDKEDFQANIEKDENSGKMSDLKISEKVVEGDEDKAVDIVKDSTLNPNAKEFVLNPNAKSFTPRSMTVSSPQTPVPIHPQRMHSQSPLMAVPHAQMMPGMGQPVFTAMAPQYVMQATPVSMALTSPFAASLQQPPRLRKVPLMQPRHDITPSMHVAAATGQPILAPNPIPNPSQLAMQYTPPPGMIHAPGPPQQTMAYPQMSYVVGPRVMSPQPIGMVPTSHTVSYCDTAHLNAHVFMHAHPSAAALSAVTAAHSMQQGVAAQHSNHHPPQSHTPVIHPSPSPVHQPPPSHVNPSQPPTPTTVIYPGQISQHAMQNNHHNPSHINPAAAHVTHHPASNFPTGPQPVVLMQGQTMPGSHGHHHHPHHPGSMSSGPHPLQLHSIHHQNPTPGSHVGNPTQVMSQMTVIPTSGTIVSAPTTMASSPFVPHHQGV